ncbi:metallophosphoesterase [Streptacidiphilus sp. N1-12]|uniref:Metallophosphoesterase n=2 Tax=Streptacidiphilus alkalitolerans TaxID=3342712 RepID=A0ABV6WNT8_9ACTN
MALNQEIHGPAPWEGAVGRHGPFQRVAVLSDVHANVPALMAVLDEVEREAAELVVFCGDLTWGAEPERTVQAVRSLGRRTPYLCLRGNSERAVIDMARGTRSPGRPREYWMVAQHTPAVVEFVAAFPFSAIVEITGLGPVRFCHGSPRSDTELMTPGTPEDRFTRLCADVEEQVLVTGHTHLQFDRMVAGRRSINPGSVGLPHHDGRPGTAYWAMLGSDDVELRQTRYDVAEALAAGPRLGDPAADAIAGLLNSPPSPAEIIEEAEELVFSD